MGMSLLPFAPLTAPACAFIGGITGSVIVRQPHTAAGEDTVVPLEVAMEIEMCSQPCIVQHAPSVSADRKIFTGFDTVMFVEHKHVGMIGYRATVNHGLAIVFARR